MLTKTEETQQDIYFRMLRIMQSLRLRDCADKAIFANLQGPIIGQREKISKLLERALNAFQTNGEFWDVQVGNKLEFTPGLALLYPTRTQSSLMFKGHTIIVSEIEKEKLKIYDPSNQEPIYVAKMRLAPMVLSYFNLNKVSASGQSL